MPPVEHPTKTAMAATRPHRVTLTVAVERSVVVGSEASMNSAAEEVVSEISRRLPDLALVEVTSIEPVERRRGERRREGGERS